MVIIENPIITAASKRNNESALNLALLLHFNEFFHFDIRLILEKICQFSYKGDIRMKWRMENPQKVQNLVDG